MASIDDIIASATLREETVPICVAEELNAQHEELVRRLQELDDWRATKMGDEDPRLDIARQIAAVEERMTGATYVFRFKALPHKRMKTLLRKHTDEDTGVRDVDSLMPELVVLCCSDPKFESTAKFDELAEHISQGQYDKLTAAAWRVNAGIADVPKSARASELIRNSGQK
jgi:hypothetical protein